MPSNNFKIGEMLNKRTKNSKTWMNFNGSYTTEIYSNDVHFEDENGNWQNINTDLFDETDFDLIESPVAKEGVTRYKEAKKESLVGKKKSVVNRDLFGYQGLKVPFDCHIPRNIKRGYTIGKGSDKLTFVPVSSTPSKGALEVFDRSVMKYQDVWNDTDIELQVLRNGIKETLVLKTEKAPSFFSFEVKGREISQGFTAGALNILPAWLVDAEGQKRDVGMEIRKVENRVFLDLKPDLEGLVFPVYIDPTVTVTGNKDTYILDSQPDTNFGNSDMIYLSKTKTSGRSDGLLKFNLDGINSESIITSATLNLYLTETYLNYTGENSFYFIPYLTSQSWEENTATWNNMNGKYIYNGSYGGTYMKDRETGWKTSNVTDHVTKWVNQNVPNLGFYLYTNTNYIGYAKISSSNATNGKVPYLSITYNDPPTRPVVLSPNSGERINSHHTIKWSASTDTETSQQVIQYQVQLSLDNGGSWKDIVPLTNGGATEFVYDFINEPETSNALVRVRAFDGSIYGEWDRSNGVFTIDHNDAPTTPTNLLPSGGISQDNTNVIRLSWKHNDSVGDSQAKFELQWKLQGNTSWNDLIQVTVNQYWEAPSNTFPTGTIEWRVKTYDQEGLPSPYSSIATFQSGSKPTAPIITNPLENGLINAATPTVQWSSLGQVGYHMQLLDETGALVWEIISNSTNKAKTLDYTLKNDSVYTIQLAVKNSLNLWSLFDSVRFSTSFTPPPQPEFTIVPDQKSATISIQIANPTPTGSQPVSDYNEVFRRKKGENNWKRIATSVEVNGVYEDYTTASEVTYEYFIRAWGENLGYKDSGYLEASVKVAYSQLALVRDPNRRVLIKYNSELVEKRSSSSALMQFSGREYPIVEYGEHSTLNFDLNFLIMDESELDLLREFANNREILLFRDRKGRKEFVSISDIEIKDNKLRYYSVAIPLTKVFYMEEV